MENSGSLRATYRITKIVIIKIYHSITVIKAILQTTVTILVSYISVAVVRVNWVRTFFKINSDSF